MANQVVQIAAQKDDLRSLFHLLVGKPDSTIKVFDGPFEISLAALATLNSQVNAKLKNHSIETESTSAVIAFTDRTIKEFGSLSEFFDQSWTGSEKTDDVSLKWDFLVTLPNYGVPQRHTLTVRFGKGPTPREAIDIMFSRDDRGMLDLAMTPAVCRVDFVNPVLGKELLNLVSEWHAGLKGPNVGQL